MTALVSSQPPFLLHSETPSTGILRNSRSIQPALSTPVEQPPPLTSSSSSASPSSRSRASTFGDNSGRKIRFAPLPDPRRDSFPSVFYQDESDSDSPSPAQPPRQISSPLDVPPSPAGSPANSAPSLHDHEPHSHSDDPACHEKSTKFKGKNWGQKLLRPLLRPLLPSSGSKGGEDPSQNPCCSSWEGSKHKSSGNGDVAEEPSKWGIPLGRSVSTNSITLSKETERSRTYRDGAPLAPVLSESGTGSVRARKDGQRMLNGHVYGRRPSSADRSRAEGERQRALDPEFVEWGYGGMGSVNHDHNRGRSTGLDWAKVQSRGRTFVETETGDGEGDDGSGMGWVKRRREKREREQREKEEHERVQKEHSVPAIEIHSPESKEPQNEQVSTRGENAGEAQNKDEDHRIYRAVSVPAAHHHHTRHHSFHGTSGTSGSATPTSAASLSRTNSVVSTPQINENEAPLKVETASSESGSSINSLASKSSSESLSDGDGSTERESEDEDDLGEERARRTSRSAGVEKISLHKE